MALARAQGVASDERPRMVTTMFEETVAKHGDWTAIDFLGATTSYREFAESVERAAAGLQFLGVTAGTRVALCLPNTPHYSVLFLATLKAGGVVVNVNPLYVERELRHLLVDSGAEIIAACDLPEVHRRVSAVAFEVGLRHMITCPVAGALPFGKSLAYRLLRRRDIAKAPRGDGHVAYSSLLTRGRAPMPVAVAPDAVAVLQYTGGTPGQPKAAMLSHANLVAQADAMVVHVGGEKEAQEHVLGVLPLFHVFGLTTVLTFALRVGAKMILLPRYDLKQTLRAIARTRPTFFPAVPTIFNAIAEAAGHQAVDLGNIRACISGGAPLPSEVREAFERQTRGRLVEGYGLSEASPIITCNPIDGPDKPASAGRPFPGTTIEIRDPEAPSSRGGRARHASRHGAGTCTDRTVRRGGAGHQSPRWPSFTITCGTGSILRDRGKILLVRHLLHPGHGGAVHRFLDRDVGHCFVLGRTVPMLVPGRAPQDVAGMELELRAALDLGPAHAFRDDQRLPGRMRVPGGARAWLEMDDRAADAGGIRALELAGDGDLAREKLCRAVGGLHGRLAGDFHLRFSLLCMRDGRQDE